MAHALVVLDHRHARVLVDEADQALAAARNEQIEDVVELHHLHHRLAAEVLHQRHGVLVHAGVAQGLAQAGGDGGVGAHRFLAAAQDHAVAGLQAQRRGVGGDVGTRLVDHADHTQRHAHALDLEALVGGVALGDLADRVRQAGDVAQRVGDAGQALLVQRQAVEHGLADALLARGLHVLGVGGQDGLGLGIQLVGHGTQQRVLGVFGKFGHLHGGLLALERNVAHGIGHAVAAPVVNQRRWGRRRPGRRDGRRNRRSCSRGSSSMSRVWQPWIRLTSAAPYWVMPRAMQRRVVVGDDLDHVAALELAAGAEHALGQQRGAVLGQRARGAGVDADVAGHGRRVAQPVLARLQSRASVLRSRVPRSRSWREQPRPRRCRGR